MKMLMMMVLVTFSLTSFAQVGQKLANGNWAYYGDDFYALKTSGSITKEFIAKVLESDHSITAGKYDTLGSCRGDCYQHHSVGYDGARKILFGEIYLLNVNGKNAVRDVYCGKVFTFQNADTVSGMHADVNIEHTWPQSKFNPRFEKGTQKSDMHHLFLTDSKANSNRGNLDFADLTGVANEITAQNCDISVFGRAARGGMAFMPPATHRGNLARALMYFATHYNMEIKPDQEAAIRAWHKADPVDADEIRHHEMIAKHQNVRNPFVDHPELADLIPNL